MNILPTFEKEKVIFLPPPFEHINLAPFCNENQKKMLHEQPSSPPGSPSSRIFPFQGPRNKVDVENYRKATMRHGRLGDLDLKYALHQLETIENNLANHSRAPLNIFLSPHISLPLFCVQQLFPYPPTTSLSYLNTPYFNFGS